MGSGTVAPRADAERRRTRRSAHWGAAGVTFARTGARGEGGTRVPRRKPRRGNARRRSPPRAAVCPLWTRGDTGRMEHSEAHLQPSPRRRSSRVAPATSAGRDRHVHARRGERLGHCRRRRRVDGRVRHGRLLGDRHHRPHPARRRRREPRHLPRPARPWTGTSRPPSRSTRRRSAAAPGSTTSSAARPPTPTATACSHASPPTAPRTSAPRASPTAPRCRSAARSPCRRSTSAPASRCAAR